MLAILKTGSSAVRSDTVSEISPGNASSGGEPQHFSGATSQDVRSALTALRREFPGVTHIGRTTRELQRGMRDRAIPSTTQNPLANAALGLLSAHANFTAGFLGTSIPTASGVPDRGATSAVVRVSSHEMRKGFHLAASSLEGYVADAGGASVPVANSGGADVFSAAQLQPDAAHRILLPEWLAGLDFNAFDDVAFLQACEQTIDDPASLQERLDAVYQCFQPVLSSQRSAVSIEGLRGRNLSIFFEHLFPALGLGDVPAQGLDPVFAQALFNRWFFSLASPPDGHGNGGNNAFPLEGLLLRLTHAPPRDAAEFCSETSPLSLINLKAALVSHFLQESPQHFPAAQKWVMDGLLSLFEPTLVRADIPQALYYGSLEWALLDIGIRLAGAQHWEYSHAELIALAVAIDAFGDDALDRGSSMRDIDVAALGSLLRMAHAQQAIDLRDVRTDGTLQIAVTLFRSQMASRKQSHSIAGLLAALPLRSDTVSAALKESGLDPGRRFTLARPGRAEGLLGSQTRQMPGLNFGVSHSLLDFVMADCVNQLLAYGKPPEAVAALLASRRAILTHDAIKQRFEKEFNAAFDPFSDGMFTEALRRNVARMDDEDAQFWRCGKAIIAIPEVEILTKVSIPSGGGLLAFGAMVRTKLKNYRATKGFLIELTMERNSGQQKRHYWLTREPLAVARFNGDIDSLLKGKLNDFFEIDNPHNRAIALNPDKNIIYKTYINIERRRTEIQFISRRLLDSIVSQTRLLAYQMTGPEAVRDRLQETLIGLMPLGTCVSQSSTASRLSGQIFCALDILTLIPVVRAGAGIAGAVGRIGTRMSSVQLKKLGISLMKNTVERGDAAQIAPVLEVGVSVLEFTRQAAHWLNPLSGISTGFSWLTRLGRGDELILGRLRISPALAGLTAAIEHSSAERKLFYPDGGFWHAVSEVIYVKDGLRQCALDGKQFSVIDMGSSRNILALRHGADLRLANPKTGLSYGPPLLSDAVSRIEMQAGLTVTGACRSKRADDILSGCYALIPSPRFGMHAYRLEQQKPHDVFHIGFREEDAQKIYLKKINLNLNGCSSYGVQNGMREDNTPYFVFDGAIWEMENNRLQPTSAFWSPPDYIEASFMHFPEISHTVTSKENIFVSMTIELPPIAGHPQRYFNRITMPFGNYPGIDGECMGMTLVANVPYKFKMKEGWLVEPLAGQRVQLQKPVPWDYEIFNFYQTMNKLPLPDDFIEGSVRQLQATNDVMRRRFDIVLQRTEELLDDASNALLREDLDASLVMSRFVPKEWQLERARNFKAAMTENLKNLRSALPMLHRQKYTLVGVGKSMPPETKQQGSTSIKITSEAVAYRGSMKLDMYFNHLNKPLIMYDEAHFLTATIDTLAADLIHELSHARISSRDQMSLSSSQHVYPFTDDNQIDIAPLLEAAKRDDSDSANHASTIEQLLMALAYTQSDDTKVLLEDMLGGGTCFSYKEEAPATSDCFGGRCVLSRVG